MFMQGETTATELRSDAAVITWRDVHGRRQGAAGPLRCRRSGERKSFNRLRRIDLATDKLTRAMPISLGRRGITAYR